MPKKMRMTLPKKEKDIEKVVEEVQELHPELAHEHEHAHVHELDELLHVIDVLMDTVNTRLSDLEEKTEKLRSEITDLYRLLAVVMKALVVDDANERVKILGEALNILEKRDANIK